MEEESGDSLDKVFFHFLQLRVGLKSVVKPDAASIHDIDELFDLIKRLFNQGVAHLLVLHFRLVRHFVRLLFALVGQR